MHRDLPDGMYDVYGPDGFRVYATRHWVDVNIDLDGLEVRNGTVVHRTGQYQQHGDPDTWCAGEALLYMDTEAGLWRASDLVLVPRGAPAPAERYDYQRTRPEPADVREPDVLVAVERVLQAVVDFAFVLDEDTRTALTVACRSFGITPKET